MALPSPNSVIYLFIYLAKFCDIQNTKLKFKKKEA
jgi:hypothetical protein